MIIDTLYAAAFHQVFQSSLNKCFLDIYNYFGSWEAAWKCGKNPPGLGIPEELWEKFIFEKGELEPLKLGEYMDKKGIKLITRQDSRFPASLLQISNIPCILYYCGDLSLADQKAVAVVGSRKATAYGIKQARKISGELASSGLVIISGLARGIDGAAHEGALEAGGKTAAVLGSGLDVPYPRENVRLFHEISEKGLVISEFPPGTQPFKYNFPVRNRIISGLSQGVFIVEAAARSGSLITCDCALEQGKEVFALPGPVTSLNSIGTLRLLQSGAKLVIHSGDILEELGCAEKSCLFDNRKEKESQLSHEERWVLDRIFWEPTHIDQLIGNNKNQFNLHKLLLNLEVKGLIKQLPGNYYLRV
ncbi:MAG: DNA-processing protein DprA [Peptococcaceae bacterium]|jgi:DNA processing protein|nr:DNA-processing protein DprA [Peptococcaceae bacterium]MDH7524022.1 DNA-processing protein DprA [Peptococcaceae bacterium]